MAQSTQRGEGSDLLLKLHEVLDGLRASNTPIKYNISIHGNYVASRLYLKIFATLGWTLIVIGVLIILFALGGSSSRDLVTSMLSRLGLPFGFSFVISGVLIVVQNQIARASIDAADYARQSLEIQALHYGVRSPDFGVKPNNIRHSVESASQREQTLWR